MKRLYRKFVKCVVNRDFIRLQKICKDFKHQCCLECVDGYMLIRQKECNIKKALL